MFEMKNRKLKGGVIHTTGDKLRKVWHSGSHPTANAFVMSTFWILLYPTGEYSGHRGDRLRRFA